jgi:putative transposase
LTREGAYGVFEHELDAVRRRYGFVAAGYVLMPEHVHLLVGEPHRSSLSVAIQVLKQQTPRKLKQRGEVRFWQRRYYDFNVHRRVAQVPIEVNEPRLGAPGPSSAAAEGPRMDCRCILRFMTERLVRYQHCGDMHFLTFSCYRRLPYLGTPQARNLFEDALERIRKKYRFVVAGYVAMPEHIHLLVNEAARSSLDRAIKSIKLSVALRSRERPFWQARYYDFNVHNEEKRVEKLRYMHRNPVSRGLVEKPEQWQWSSFRHYATGEVGTVEIESEWTASRRGHRLPEHLRYAEKAG